MFPFISFRVISEHMDEIVRSKVSVKARSAGQFLSVYKEYGKRLPEAWALKRENFIKRTLAAYRIKPSRRRYLSLIAWAYSPDY